MQHAHGKGLAAYRADIVQLHAFGRFQNDAAGPVPVEVILAFLGEEFQRARVAGFPLLLMQGVENAVVGGRAFKERGLPGEVLPGMGVGT